MASILDCVVQPVWVADQAGLILFANPSAVAALGYGDAAQLLGKPSHQTIHYKRPDGSSFPVEDCPMLLPRMTGETIHRLGDWFVRRDGSMFPVEYWSAPIDMPSGRGAVVAFTDVSERLRAEGAVLEAALDGVIGIDERGCVAYINTAAERIFGYRAGEVMGRELAELVVPPSQREAHRQGLARYLATGQARMLDQRIEMTAMRADGSEFPAEVTVTRIGLSGSHSAFVGYIRDITDRKRAEQELMAARERLKAVADEQAALRRVATLVAEGAAPRKIFDAVCEETGLLIGAASVSLAHFPPDGTNLTMAGWGLHGTHVPPGTRLPLHGSSISDLVKRTGAPGRVDRYEGLPGPFAARLRELGTRSEIGAPVVVGGSVWGALIAGMDTPEPLPEGADLRIARFAELIGTAVSNAAAHTELVASRARMVTAFDAARQRLTRDLHDGAQQRFVSSIINLQLSQQKWSSAPQQAKELLGRAFADARDGLRELREIAAGIHPAILTQRGLAAALDTLAARLPLPVELDIAGQRLPGAVESSVYFFCSEALTNVVKHARATSASVRVALEDDYCIAEVRDDGIGGAEPRSRSSGLTGLHDRVGALGGTVEVSSPAGAGTALRAWIPLTSESPAPGYEFKT